MPTEAPISGGGPRSCDTDSLPKIISGSALAHLRDIRYIYLLPVVVNVTVVHDCLQITVTGQDF